MANACRRYISPQDKRKLNGIDPELYGSSVLRRITNRPIGRLAELRPWNAGQITRTGRRYEIHTPNCSHVCPSIFVELKESHHTPRFNLHQEGPLLVLPQSGTVFATPTDDRRQRTVETTPVLWRITPITQQALRFRKLMLGAAESVVV
jgi:hypothetical protein